MRQSAFEAPSDRIEHTINERLDRLTTPSRLGQRPGLERIAALLECLGNPHRGMRILHVGGTSGKGSTSTIAARIMQEQGMRVGLHVKPHLQSVTERFVIDGNSIDSGRLIDLIGAAEKSARAIGPSWYELTVALAFRYFCDENVDVAVVEVGLGGTYDATNVVDPAAVILTNVGLDHTEVLGDTVEQIALDKVGIVKAGIPVVSGFTQNSTREIVGARCRSLRARLWSVGDDFSYHNPKLGIGHSTFDLTLPTRQLNNLVLRPLGGHQIANAAVAVAGVESIAPAGTLGDEPAIRRALGSVEIPGRLEAVHSKPLVLLDGAHNPDKMSALSEALDALYPDRNLTVILAFKKGHDLGATLRSLGARPGRFILTRFDAVTDYGRGQAVDPTTIADALDRIGSLTPRVLEDDPEFAIQSAIQGTSPDDIIVVTGSLYLVGVVRSWFLARR